MKKAISILISGAMMMSSVPFTAIAAEDQLIVVPETVSTINDNISENKKNLTLEDIDELSKKGNELSWKDFDNYNYRDTGEGVLSGINREYAIDEEYSLMVIGKDLESKPETIVLSSNKGFAVEIRSSEYQDFFAKPVMYLITEMPDVEYKAYINVILDNGSLYWCPIAKFYADTIVNPSEYTDDRAKSPRGLAKKDLKLDEDILDSIKAVGKEIAENSEQNELVECTGYTITSERERLFLVNDGKSYAAADFGENCKMINNENVQKLIAELVATGYSETVSAVDEKNGISGSYSENITWTLDEDGKLTLSGEGEIPDSNDNAPWFDHKMDIKTIVVGEGITKIGKNAFRDLEYVTSVSLPEGIKSISDEAFCRCINLRTIKLPDSLEIIGSYAFFKCQLDSLTLPDNVTEIGEYAFSDTNLSSVIIPKGVKCIDGAFSYNGNLKEVVIPDTVSNIDGAFKYCISLKEVKIPSSVEKLRDDTFKSCNQLEILIFMNPDTIVCDENGNESETFFMTDGGFHGRIKGYKGSTAEEYAQKYHITFIALDDLETPLSGSYSENITWTLDSDGKLTLSGEGEIPDRDGITPWFGQMVNIKTIVVGEGITKIGKAVFLGLESVTSATLPEGLKSIDDGAFEKCVNLKKINIPDGVESIGIQAFYMCPLESLGLPESIKTIGEKAFVCGKFRSIELPSSITRLENGVLGACEYLNEVTIPDTVTYIGGAFQYNHSLKSITLPESVEEISYRAFSYCENLETIIFENPDTIIFDEEGDVHDSFFYAWGGEDFKGVVKGYKGSTAEKYAEISQLEFEALISKKAGDSNGDGRMNMSDAVLIMQSIANPDKYGLNGTDKSHITEQGQKNADTNGDGITNLDALAIQKKLLKLD